MLALLRRGAQYISVHTAICFAQVLELAPADPTARRMRARLRGDPEP